MKEDRYTEALNAAKMWYHNTAMPDNVKEIFRRIFPELKENEEEQNIKDLIDELKCSLRAANFQNDACGGGHEKRIALLEWSIAWLEKQDCKDIHLLELKAKAYDDTKERMSYAYNQNRVPIGFINEIFPNIKLYENQFDKVEPKFKVGQWIVLKDKCYKVNYNGCGYELIDQSGLSTSLEYGTIDENAHLWTAQDANDGDVLASDCSVFIFQKEYIAGKPTAYCGIVEGNFYQVSGGCWTNEQCHPATKEQWDTLRSKMKEAGYEWDSEKKELKEITASESEADDEEECCNYGIQNR